MSDKNTAAEANRLMLEQVGEFEGMPLYKIDLSKLPRFQLMVQPNPHFKGSGLGADYASTHEEMRAQIEATQAVKDAEREVIDAAVRLAQMPQHIDFREEYEAAEEAVVEAARKLIAARAEGE